MSFAIAVRIPGSSVRSIAGRLEAPTQRVRRGDEHRRVVGQRLLAQRTDLFGLHKHRPAYVLEHCVEVALAFVEERIQEARRAGVVDAALAPALEQSAMLEEHVDELPQHVVERLDELLADAWIGCRRVE